MMANHDNSDRLSRLFARHTHIKRRRQDETFVDKAMWYLSKKKSFTDWPNDDMKHVLIIDRMEEFRRQMWEKDVRGVFVALLTTMSGDEGIGGSRSAYPRNPKHMYRLRQNHGPTCGGRLAVGETVPPTRHQKCRPRVHRQKF